MRFDIQNLQQQLATALIVSPYPHELAVAIICDTFRMANVRPPSLQDWQSLETYARHPLWREQVQMLAHLLAGSALRDGSAKAMGKGTESMNLLRRFFEDIAPLTAEMVRSNGFRQEEFLRKWVRAVGGEVLNESPKESAKRLDQLDYRKAQQEMKRAEEARKKEAERREQLLREAQQREAEARGWRE
ncbi:hypothetical protein JY651_38610 [Pyxidicoccus parkwayensis]|uniref:Uncharacterized protein n=1 Tax=Pyxidicoccus parkwayensis TaxID=2813578 RepID=A0ABX7NQK1_9BACT|nr:hypothetical protein [Pyxidicoccus parkwaysis]QSQ21065.1 hypothetical protein JY651_38610 [Pyxidicoccus parkwaysis]